MTILSWVILRRPVILALDLDVITCMEANVKCRGEV